MSSSTVFVLFFGLVSTMLVVMQAYPLTDEQDLEYAEEYHQPGYYLYFEEPEHQVVAERTRRSLQPGSGAVHDDGAFRTEVNKDEEGNTRVGVSARGNVYNHGRHNVDAEAQWSKVVSGPRRSKPQVGASVTYRW